MSPCRLRREYAEHVATYEAARERLQRREQEYFELVARTERIKRMVARVRAAREAREATEAAKNKGKEK